MSEMATEPESPLAEAAARVGDRWTLLIIESLLEGPLRFGDLVERIGIASNILSQRPKRYEYELTASGRELAGALRLLADWGARHAEGSEPLRHGACGTPLEAR